MEIVATELVASIGIKNIALHYPALSKKHPAKASNVGETHLLCYSLCGTLVVFFFSVGMPTG